MSTASAAKQFEQHPIALQYAPGTMSPEEFEALGEDMSAMGQQYDIVLYEGKILDGWHRYQNCLKFGLTPKFTEYKGTDPARMAITLNIMRRKLGTIQRALAGAQLCLNFNISQDIAAKRVGVSKVHVNLVTQALRSKNARILKLLENANLTREKLHEELVECGVIRESGAAIQATTPTVASAVLSSAAATHGLEHLFDHAPDEDVELEDLDDILGDAPPSANGRVLPTSSRTGPDQALPNVGTKPGHPERRNRETPAYQLAERVKALTEPERISFIQIVWPAIRPLLKVAGVSVDPPAGSPAALAEKAVEKAKTTPPPPVVAARSKVKAKVKTKTK